MDQLLVQARAFFAKHSFVLVIAAVTLATVIGAARIAIPARRQKAELAAEAARLEAVIASSTLWVTQFQPASNEESAMWQNTAADIQGLGVRPSERLTLAQVVARRADEAGLSAAHIKFLPLEAASPAAARAVAGVTFNPAQYKLQLTGGGSFGTLTSLLGALPPAVELQSVSLTGGGDQRVATSLTLSVFEPAGANGK